jgi:hypothetical protein
MAKNPCKYLFEVSKGEFKEFTEAELKDYLIEQDLSKLKPIQDAIQERSAEEVLQREQAEAGKTGGEGRGMEPSKQGKEAPIEVEVYDEGKVESPRQRKKSLLNSLLSGKLSEKVKEELEKDNVYFEANMKESEDMAKSIVSSLGVENAIIAAKNNEVHPSVGSAIFAESINDLYRQEQRLRNEGRIEEADNVALRQADLITEYSDISTSSGQWIAQIKRFYKTSPIGVVRKINTERKQQFQKEFAGQEKDFKTIFEDLLKGEEGQAILKIEAEKIVKEERKADRQKRDKAIDDFFEKAKLKGNVSYATIIPPAVWNSAMDVLKVSVKGGDRIVVSVQKAIEYIDAELKGKAWDKDRFKKDYEDSLNKELNERERDLTTSLEKRKKELERRINENDFSAEEYKEKRTLNEKEEAAKKDYNEVKKAYDEAKKQSPEYIDKKSKQYLERFKSRLKGIDNAKKEEIIKRSMSQLVKNGALQYEEFKNIIAETIGLKELSPEDITKIESLMDKINATKDLEDAMVENSKSAEARKRYDEAVAEASNASTELYNIVSKESNITSTLKSLITGSLLGVPSLIKNPIQNIIFQGQLRFPKAVVKNIMEQGVYGASVLINKYISSESPIYKPKANLLLAQKGYFPQGGLGIVKGFTYFKKGITVPDFNSTNAYQSSLSPKQAARDLKLYKSGEKFLTKTEIVDRYIRKSWPSRQADFILRAMGFGDMPQRYAAEGAAAQQIAVKELGLTDDNEIIAFMRSPQKMAYKIYSEQGKTQADALSEEIQKRIIKEGEKAVFQEKNMLSNISEWVDSGLKIKKEDRFVRTKAVASVLKTLNYPFIKIPANVAWASFKAANPLFSLGQAGIQAAAAKRYEQKGNFAKSKEYTEMSKDSFAHAAVGYGLSLAAAYMIAAGLVRPENDKDTKAKEYAGEEVFGKQNQLNLGGALGLDDYWVDLTWFGPYGVILNTKAQLARDKAEMAKNNEEQSWAMDQIDNMTYSAKSSLNQLVFDQGSKMIDAMMNGGPAAKSYFVNNVVNNISNIPVGATYTQFSKNALPYKAALKGETAWEQIKNNQKQRNVALRLAMNFYKPGSGNPPFKISPFTGEPIKTDNSVLGVIGGMMGAEKGSNDKFGAVIINDFEKTGNLNFLPPASVEKITVNGKKIDLPMEQRLELQSLIGKSTKKIISPFVYGASTLANFKRYTDPSITEQERGDALNTLYGLARTDGLNQFKKNHPEYKESELTSIQEMRKEQEEDWKERLKDMFQIEEE